MKVAASILASAAMANANIVPGSWMVQLRADEDLAQSMAAHAHIHQAHGLVISKIFDISPEFRGYAFHTNSSNLDAIQSAAFAAGEIASNEDVQLIEAVQEYHVNAPAPADTCNHEQGATWGIARVSSDNTGTSVYDYPGTAGEAATAYIIDTGVRSTHEEFTGRIVPTEVYDAYRSKNDARYGEDGNGHGTHVAGTIAGTLYGVAKNAKIGYARVLNDFGSGATNLIIDGIAWACAEGAGRPPLKKRVANMSLGGGKSQMLNNAVAACIDKGMTFVLAAGNEAQNACNVSPASEPKAITVMSSTRSDGLSSFSNYGPCADIIAPGSDIKSAWNTGDSATNVISGTSMASPHVAGVAALLITENDNVTPAQVKDVLRKTALENKISLSSRISGNTDNLLVHHTC